MLQAEILLFLSGAVICDKLLSENKDPHRAENGYFCWIPWLLLSNGAIAPLPFFQQAENREGVENLLTCLGIEHSQAGVLDLKATVKKYQFKAIDQEYRKIFQMHFPDCLNTEKWYDKFPDRSSPGQIPEGR